MTDAPKFELPYASLVPRLVNSATRALAELVAPKRRGLAYSEANHQLINRHFAWLGIQFSDGVNRHLYDGDDGNGCRPLKNNHLRARRQLPVDVREIFDRGESVPSSNLEWMQLYVRKEPTRISQLIVRAVERSHFSRSEGASDSKVSEKKHSTRVWLPSPLSIVQDFLTIPAFPGSRAYVALTLRNYLFESFGVFPDNADNFGSLTKFSERDLEEAISVIWTSFRPRYFSKGHDTLPSRGRNNVDGLVRHFLSMNGVLDLTFRSKDAARKYFSESIFKTSNENLEFGRALNLKNLPELAEIVNQLWGLPIPVRGADTIFRGGLKFPARRGLVCALHGGPGSGKTSLSLGFAAALAPFGIRTMFITAEEQSADLKSRASGLVASDFRRLSFSPQSEDDWLKIVELNPTGAVENVLKALSAQFDKIGTDLRKWNASKAANGAPSIPCRTIVVLDGLHDLVRRCEKSDPSSQNQLQDFIESCKKLEALVILTTGVEWEGDRSIDYLVDIAMRLSQEGDALVGSKPDRNVTLSKARHQLCSPGTHGFQLSGQKGIRFTPQINYQLDRLAIWEPQLPDQSVYKDIMRRVISAARLRRQERWRADDFLKSERGTRIFGRSNIFLNGQGSGGKAALALKIATSPYVRASDESIVQRSEKVLVISFLYPQEYYDNLHDRLRRNRLLEYGKSKVPNSRVEVMHLYPGHLKPSTLFNRIMWALDESDLYGDPFTAVVIDGIHNVFIQFPEIERNQLFWPQLFSMLGLRHVSVIVTHTLLSLDVASGVRSVDDSRSDPLRHALVQKTDFSFEIDPEELDVGGVKFSNCFSVSTRSAIGQSYSGRDGLFWHRENLIFIAKESVNIQADFDFQ
ncbi:ATPase domain-containing protein [Novosphingobium sp. P6W]|uniref:RAD55 family ATPase n=1 Tax=Novosphingobium sp. P6W TaxID=1609758 RepID=UPI0009E38DED|nr:ATPase domain-containing protein [Novosphingobium sp. P6W]AXB75908.1 hypothetical protein TQ38_004735 [Novosphingobium sp. P6W]